MGFSTIATHVVLFSVVIVMAAGLSISFANYQAKIDSSMRDQQDLKVSQLKTDMTIINAHNTSDRVILYIKNIGSEVLSVNTPSLNITNLFIDNTQVADYDTTVLNDGQNSGLWDPTETILVNASYVASAGEHKALFVVENGISVEKLFSA